MAVQKLEPHITGGRFGDLVWCWELNLVWLRAKQVTTHCTISATQFCFLVCFCFGANPRDLAALGSYGMQWDKSRLVTYKASTSPAIILLQLQPRPLLILYIGQRLKTMIIYAAGQGFGVGILAQVPGGQLVTHIIARNMCKPFWYSNFSTFLLRSWK